MTNDFDRIDEQLANGHLTDASVEALVDGRDDLLGVDAHAHALACETCAAWVASAREDLHRVAREMALSFDEGALASLVARAVHGEIAVVRSPSPRALSFAGLVASLTALTLGAFSFDGWPSSVEVEAMAHRARSVLVAGERLVSMGLPGGWATATFALVAMLFATVAPLRRLVAASAPRAVALLFFVAVSTGATARALDFQGEWPADEKITVVAENVPSSVALERAAASAGLGFIGVLAVDPTTNVRVRDASLRDVIIAVLGRDAPFVVERSATLLTVRAPATAAAQPAPVATAPVAAAPVVAQPAQPSPAAPTMQDAPPIFTGDDHRDRVRFGGDVTVRADESVENVMTFGGHVTIEGEVEGDVVTFGGDIHLRPGARVHGEIVPIGGRLYDASGAHHAAFGHDADEDPATEWLSSAFESGASHALLFLLGLLLLGLAPTRLSVVTNAVTERPGRAVLAGALAAFAALVLALLLFITIIGIPAAILVALAFPLCMYAGLAAVAAVLGRVLPIAWLEGSPVRQLAAGVFALFVVSLVPILGGAIGFFASLAGVGAMVLTRAGQGIVSSSDAPA
jgi:hypothetical protein